ERVRVRIKNVRLPVAGERSDVSAQRTKQLIGVAGQNPGVEEWIAQVARYVVRDAERGRPGQRDREANVGDGGNGRIAQSAARVTRHEPFAPANADGWRIRRRRPRGLRPSGWRGWRRPGRAGCRR